MLSFSTLYDNIINPINTDLLFLFVVIWFLLFVFVFLLFIFFIIFSGESTGDLWVVFVLLKSMIKVSITKLFETLKMSFRWQLSTVLNGRQQDKSVKPFWSYRNTYKTLVCFKKTFVWNCQKMTSYVNQNLLKNVKSFKTQTLLQTFPNTKEKRHRISAMI